MGFESGRYEFVADFIESVIEANTCSFVQNAIRGDRTQELSDFLHDAIQSATAGVRAGEDAAGDSAVSGFLRQVRS